jgi:hypothetical protein
MWDLKSLALPWWVKPAAALAVCASLLCTGWVVRGWRDASATLAQVRKDQKAVMDANLKAEIANTRLIAELRKPKAGVEIREVVRTNPSQCVLPAPVFDSLLKSVREANAAR